MNRVSRRAPGTRPAPIVAAAACVVAMALVTGLGIGLPAAGAAERGPYGLAAVKLQTKTSGGGVHPVLKWKAVPNAAQYRVVVRDAKKRPYWAWLGTTPRVTVSATGKAVPKNLAFGPRVAKNYRWSVSAYDAAGRPIALSKEQVISP